jgi:hypothetical protein
VSVWQELVATLEDGFEDPSREALVEASDLLDGLASTDDETRVWSIDQGDDDELRAIVFAAACLHRPPPGAPFAGRRLGSPNCWAQLVAEVENEEIDPACCRATYERARRHGDHLALRVAQLRPSRRLGCVALMHPDDLRCAALAAALREQQTWSL